MVVDMGKASPYPDFVEARVAVRDMERTYAAVEAIWPNNPGDLPC